MTHEHTLCSRSDAIRNVCPKEASVLTNIGWCLDQRHGTWTSQVSRSRFITTTRSRKLQVAHNVPVLHFSDVKTNLKVGSFDWRGEQASPRAASAAANVNVTRTKPTPPNSCVFTQNPVWSLGRGPNNIGNNTMNVAKSGYRVFSANSSVACTELAKKITE